MADYDVDLFVIGGGSGGVRAARIAAEHGARVTVAEEYRLGGTCVIRGCVPKKLLVYASRFRGEFEDAAGFGWTVPQSSFDWTTLIANKDREIARLEAAYGATLEKAGVKVVKSRAVLRRRPYRAIGDRRSRARGLCPDRNRRDAELRRSDFRHRARHFLERGIPFAGISAPRRHPGRRLYRRRVCRNFRRPRFACDAGLSRREYFARLRRRGAPAPARRAWRRAASRSLPAAKSRRSSRPARTFRCSCRAATRITADRVMFAVGRQPNVAKLGLKEAGVELAKNGGVAVDEYSRTSVRATSTPSATSPIASISRRSRFARAMLSPTPCSAASRRRSITAMCRRRCSPTPKSARSASPRRKPARSWRGPTSTRPCSSRSRRRCPAATPPC